MNLAPIVLFTYNRPEHTRKTIEALRLNDHASESDLIVFSDAPKNQYARPAVEEVRRYLLSVEGFRSVKIIEREKNYGLASNIIDGVGRVLENHEQVIVLEDDLLTSPYFLTFMNQALDTYKDREEVLSIHGYIYPVKKNVPDSFFLIDPGSLGWATWKNRWDLYEPDGARLLQALRTHKLTRTFDYDGHFPFTKMLIDQVEGRNSSWVIRWYAYALLHHKVTLYPGKSLVFHMGSDGSGTHEGASNLLDVELTPEPIPVVPLEPAINHQAREAFKHYFRSVRGSLLRRGLRKIKKKLKI